MKNESADNVLIFRWKYLILPVIILVLSVVLAIVFFAMLPAEVSYHFESDGTPDKWLGRTAIMLWLVLPQFVLTFLAWAVARGTVGFSRRFTQPQNPLVRPESVVTVMGNMFALPQIILFFAMLDIFSYNSFKFHLLPLWVMALIVMGAGIVILGIFFSKVMQKSMKASKKL